MTGENSAANILIGVTGKLSDLPDAKLMDVVRQLDAIPTAPIVSPLLDEMRPRLRALRPERPLTARRLLCRPFEDLLYSGRERGATALVPRSVIEPGWRLLKAHDGLAFGRLERALRKLPVGDEAGILALSETLWQRAAESLTQLCDESGAAAELALVRDFLGAAPEIEAFKRAVPGKPIARLTSFVGAQIEAGLAALAARGQAPGPFLLVVAARLAHPGELLAFQRKARLELPASVARQLDAFALANLAAEASDFETRIAAAAPGDIAHQAERLLGNLWASRAGLNKRLSDPLDAQSTRIIQAVRHAISGCILTAAPPAIEAVLPVTNRAPDTDALMTAEVQARALGRSRRMARLVGLEAAVGKTIAALRLRFDDGIGRLLAEARSATTPDDARTAQRDIYRSIRLVELIEGSQMARQLLADTQRRLRPA